VGRRIDRVSSSSSPLAPSFIAKLSAPTITRLMFDRAVSAVGSFTIFHREITRTDEKLSRWDNNARTLCGRALVYVNLSAEIDGFPGGMGARIISTETKRNKAHAPGPKVKFNSVLGSGERFVCVPTAPCAVSHCDPVKKIILEISYIILGLIKNNRSGVGPIGGWPRLVLHFLLSIPTSSGSIEIPRPVCHLLFLIFSFCTRIPMLYQCVRTKEIKCRGIIINFKRAPGTIFYLKSAHSRPRFASTFPSNPLQHPKIKATQTKL
jgi:hypothetical protein